MADAAIICVSAFWVKIDTEISTPMTYYYLYEAWIPTKKKTILKKWIFPEE